MVVLAELSVKVNSATSSRRSALNDPERMDIKKNHCCFLPKTVQLATRSHKSKHKPLPRFYTYQTDREVNLTRLELRARLQIEPWAPNSQISVLNNRLGHPFQMTIQILQNFAHPHDHVNVMNEQNQTKTKKLICQIVSGHVTVPGNLIIIA